MKVYDSAEVTELLLDIEEEFYSATNKFGEFNSAHEGWAVLLEEYDECREALNEIGKIIKKNLWQEIKGKQRVGEMRKEAIQVAAMAMRFIYDVCNVKEQADEK